MPTVGSTSKPAYVYDAGSDTWIPIGPGEHSHSYIPNTLVDAKGDILTATASDTPARLAAGTNGQYLSSNSSTATGLQWVTPAAGGKVLQVVSATKTTEVTSATETYVTAMDITITPTASTSKILLFCRGSMYCLGRNTLITSRWLRDSTVVVLSDLQQFSTGSNSYELVTTPFAMTYDSPASTSAITYSFQFNRRVADTGTVRFNYIGGGLTSTAEIIALEIGA